MTILSCYVHAAVTAGAELVDIRTGFHETFSRLVLEFDAPVRYNLSEASNKILISIGSINRFRTWPPRQYKCDSDVIESIHLAYTDTTLEATVHLFSQNTILFPSYLKYPARIVIDVYPQLQQEVSGEPSKPYQEPPKKSMVFSRQLRDSTQSQFLNRLSALKPASEPNTSQNQKPPLKSKITLFVLILAVFIMVDAVLLIFYLNRNPKTPRVKNAIEPMINKQTAAHRDRSDFKNILNDLSCHNLSTESPSQEASPYKKQFDAQFEDGLKSLIESVTAALVSAPRDIAFHTAPPPSPSEVESLISSSRIPKEVWIAQDGFKFLKNLEKFDLN